jgi:RHS repeat-associated protein
MGILNGNPIKYYLALLSAATVMLFSQGYTHAATGSVPLNSLNGASTMSRTDLTVGKIFLIDITRKYNSKSGYPSPLGYGWALTYDKQLFTYADGSVIIRSGPGQKKKYTKSGSSFTSPVNDSGVLTFNSSTGAYTYTTTDGTKELYDSYGRLASITDPKGNSLVFTYASTSKLPLKGLLPENVDQTASTVIAYVYKLSKIEEYDTTGTASGKWVSFAYDSTTGMLTGLSDSLGRSITYGHDTSGYGNLTGVTGPGVVSIYGYTDPNNKHLMTTVDEGHGVFTNEYDSQGRVKIQVHGNTTIDMEYTTPTQASTVTTTIKDAGGVVISTEIRSVEFDGNRQIVKETDTLGNQIKYERYSQTWVKRKEWWKNNGTVAVPKLALDHAIDYTYDTKGNMLTQIEMDSATPAVSTFAYTTTYTYDANGNMLTETNTLGQTTTYTYTAKNQILTISGPQGNTTNTYDSNGNLLTSTDPAGATTTYAYDIRGNVTTITTATNKVTTNTYDANDAIASVTDPTGKITSFTYDTNGNLRTQTDPGNKTTTYGYDTLNRLVTIEDPLHHITTYHYDANGNRDTVTDVNGNITRFTFNDQGQSATVTDALGNITTYGYGGSGCPSCGGSGGGNLVGLTDAKGQTTGFQYDFMNRLIQETDSLLKITGYHYNNKGNLDYKTDANGAIVNYDYDALKRLTGITYPGGTGVSYSYDDAGRIHAVTNSNITYTYGYDAAGRTTSVSDSRGYVIAYEYDLPGNRTKMTIQTGTTVDRVYTYTYDDAGRPATITSSAGTFTYHYDNFGRRDSIQYPMGIRAEYTYDDLNRLTGVTNMWNTEIINSVAYTDFDNAGNRKARTVTYRDSAQPGKTNVTTTEQYQYDANYRLRSVTSNKPEAFSYDAVGNRLTGPGSKDTAYLYNDGNQMTHGRELSYAYDNNGNQTTRTVPDAVDKSWLLTWDYENRLVKMEKVKGTEKKTVTFKYDPHGRRIEKKTVTTLDGTPATTKSFTWAYVYDGDNIVVMTTDETYYPDKAYYTHGLGVDEHLALDRYNGVYNYYLNDGLGSVLIMIDGGGWVAQSFEYDSFGMTKPSSAEPRPTLYGYTGREWDKETGLYYYRARYYDPMEGRFISKDPAGFVDGANIYGYVKNNPINNLDPSGLWVTRCSRELGDKNKPPTNSNWYNLARHDYLNVSGTILSFQAGSNMIWSQGWVDNNEKQNNGGCEVICDDDKFDKYLLEAARYAPRYNIWAYPGTLTYMAGARNCQTWASEVIQKAKVNYRNKEKCGRCF